MFKEILFNLSRSKSLGGTKNKVNDTFIDFLDYEPKSSEEEPEISLLDTADVLVTKSSLPGKKPITDEQLLEATKKNFAFIMYHDDNFFEVLKEMKSNQMLQGIFSDAILQEAQKVNFLIKLSNLKFDNGKPVIKFEEYEWTFPFLRKDQSVAKIDSYMATAAIVKSINYFLRQKEAETSLAEAENSAYLAEKQQLESNHKEAQEKVTQLESLVDKAKITINESEKAIYQLQEEINKKDQRLSEVNESCDQLKSEKSELNINYRIKENELFKVRAQITRANQNYETLSTKAKESEEEKALLNKRVAELNNSLKFEQNSKEHLGQQIETLTQENAKYAQDNEKLMANSLENIKAMSLLNEKHVKSIKEFDAKRSALEEQNNIQENLREEEAYKVVLLQKQVAHQKNIANNRNVLIPSSYDTDHKIKAFKDQILLKIITCENPSEFLPLKYINSFFDLNYKISKDLESYPAVSSIYESLLYLGDSRNFTIEEKFNQLLGTTETQTQSESAFTRFENDKNLTNLFITNSRQGNNSLNTSGFDNDIDRISKIKFVALSTIKELTWKRVDLNKNYFEKFKTVLAGEVAKPVKEQNNLLSVLDLPEIVKIYLLNNYSVNNAKSVSPLESEQNHQYSKKIQEYNEKILRDEFHSFVKRITSQEKDYNNKISFFESSIANDKNKTDPGKKLTPEKLTNYNEILKKEEGNLELLKQIHERVFSTTSSSEIATKKISKLISQISDIIDLKFEYFRTYDLAQQLKDHVSKNETGLGFGLEELSNCFYFISQLRRTDSNIIPEIISKNPFKSEVQTEIYSTIHSKNHLESADHSQRAHFFNHDQKSLNKQKFNDAIKSSGLNNKLHYFYQGNVLDFLASELTPEDYNRKNFDITHITSNPEEFEKYRKAIAFIEEFDRGSFFQPSVTDTSVEDVEVEIDDTQTASSSHALPTATLTANLTADSKSSNHSFGQEYDTNNHSSPRENISVNNLSGSKYSIDHEKHEDDSSAKNENHQISHVEALNSSKSEGGQVDPFAIFNKKK